MLVDEIDERRRQREAADADAVGDVKTGYAILMSLALALVNFTLVVVARAQYGQDDVWWPSFVLALKSLPVFWILIYLLHPFDSWLASLAGVGAGVGFGCRAVWLFNNEGYYASMSRVPHLGTMWVWLIVELSPALGAATLAAVAAYTYWEGFVVM